VSEERGVGAGPAIEAHGLVKCYGKLRALDGIDLCVEPGQVFGFLGPNGAGKTTTIRILATLTRPDAGWARVFGHDVTTDADAVRALVSVTGQFASLDTDLTGMENMLLLGRLRGLSRRGARRRASDLLEAFDLTAAAGRPVASYSGGMARRLDIAASLIVTPDVLCLDEPTTGLDPRSRAQVWELIRSVAQTGTLVLLTTQYLAEADQLAKRIAVIDRGRIVAAGTSGQLKAMVGAGILRVRLIDGQQRALAGSVLGAALAGPVGLDADPQALSVPLPADASPAEMGGVVGRALSELSRCGVALAEVTLGQPSLDEAFLALTGHYADRGTAGEEGAA
jgi:ABC-2 type transport system ATP-binding protein